MGPPPKPGDGVVALPTLVHRGPGGNDAQAMSRKVLFFTIVPVYEDDDDFDEELGEYDPEKQIHAGYLIWRTGSLLGNARIRTAMGEYAKLGFDLQAFSKDTGDGEKPKPKRRKRS